MSAGPAAAQVLPVGTWSFNEGQGTVAHDTALRPANGTLQGDPLWIKGRFWNALSFDGTNSGVDIPDRSTFDAPNITVSAWVNSDTIPGRFKYIVAKGANGCSAGAYALYTGSQHGLQFYASYNGGLSFVASPDATSTIWNGAWHLVVGTFDGSTVRLYVDGKEVGNGNPDTNAIDYGLPTSTDMMIGNYPGCSGLGFTGDIDEVHVFNRALGPQEIRLGWLGSQYLSQKFPDDAVL